MTVHVTVGGGAGFWTATMRLEGDAAEGVEKYGVPIGAASGSREDCWADIRQRCEDAEGCGRGGLVSLSASSQSKGRVQFE